MEHRRAKHGLKGNLAIELDDAHTFVECKGYDGCCGTRVLNDEVLVDFTLEKHHFPKNLAEEVGNDNWPIFLFRADEQMLRRGCLK